MWSTIENENIDKIETIKYRNDKHILHSDTNDRLKSRDSTNYELKNKLNIFYTELKNTLNIFFLKTKNIHIIK